MRENTGGQATSATRRGTRRIADKYNIPWIDRIPLIETVCWGSKGWLDSALVAKLHGRWNGYRRNGQYGAFMGEVMSALSATSQCNCR